MGKNKVLIRTMKLVKASKKGACWSTDKDIIYRFEYENVIQTKQLFLLSIAILLNLSNF